MKSVSIAILICAALAVQAFAQQTAPPATLTLPAGTIITIEASEILSSKTLHTGDNFVAELQHPLVVDGWVIARPGQTVMGRIADAKRAGRVKGKSNLSLEIHQVILVDGRQLPIQSELVENKGPASHGRDIAAVAIGTGVGAAVGSVCGAKGAAIGAAVGAAASITGVLLTRGEETEISTEKLMTFRLAAPLNVSTEQGQQAFWKVTAEDYTIPDLPRGNPATVPKPVIVTQTPPRIPVTVWPETQGLAASRPGRKECGN